MPTTAYMSSLLVLAAPLDFLAPLVAVGSTLSAGLAALVNLAVISMVAAPLVALLLQSPVQRGAWRWPYAWWVALLAAMLIASQSLQGPVEDGELAALGVLGAWLALVVLTGLPRLAFRLLRFVVTGTSGTAVGLFDRAVGGLGLLAAVTGVALAVASGQAGPLGPSALVAVLALLPFLAAKAAPAAPRPVARLRWLAGTGLLAVSTPPLLLTVAALVTRGLPQVSGVPKGLVLLVVAAVGVLAGFALLRGRARPSAQAPSLTPHTA